MATTTTLKANAKLDSSIAKTYYWHSNGKELCSDHIYTNTHADSKKYRSRITFYLSESTFLDQTVISGKLKIKLQTLYSSASKTEKVGVKMSLTGGDTTAAYNEAIFVGEISNFSKENVWFTVDLNSNGISMINQAIKEQDSSISLYFGPPEVASGGDKIYGARFYGYNYSTASVRPVLDLTHVPSISTGTVTTTTPRIGSPINLTINRNLSTYTHKVEWIIGGKIYHTENSVSTSTSFTPEISKTTDYLGSKSATSISDGTYCKIYTYSSNTQNEETLMGSSEVPFTLHMASSPSIEWSTNPSIESTHPSNYYVSSFSKIKIKGGVVGFLDGSELEGYRFRMNSCGININKTQTSSSEYTTEVLSANSDTEFKVYVSIKDSRGRYSAEKEIKDTCYSYSFPQLVETNVYRAQNSAGTIIDEMGGYLIVKGKYSYKPIAGYNSITSVKVTGANLTFDKIIDASYNFSFSSSTLINPEQSYKITILLEDKFSSNKIEIPVPEGRYLIHIPRGGKGLGLGTVGENNYIKLGWPIRGLKLAGKAGEYLDLSNVTSVEGLRTALEIPEDYLKLTGGTITGNIILNGVNILNKNEKVVLRTSGDANGVGNTDEDLYLQAKNLYYTNGNKTYNILTDKTITVTLDLTDNFKSYVGTDSDSNNNYYSPGVVVKKIGKIIQVDGAISPAEAGKGGAGEANEIIICHLPEEYQPNYSIIQVCQGSGTSTWMLRIRPDGYLTFSRYRNEAGYANYTTTTWLTFHVCFIQK